MKLKAPFGLATLAFALLLLVANSIFSQTTAARSGAGPVTAPVAAPGRPTVEQVLAEINLARANPAAYAEFLTALRPLFKGNLYTHPGQPTIATNEGVAALDEAIAYLRAQPSVPAVQMAKGMCHSASDHVLDVVNNDQMSHKGTDGSMPEDRIARYGTVTGNGQIAENIAYEAYSARDIVIGFIIDDGFARRSHRLNVFSTDFTVVGIGVEGKAAVTSCVVTFAAGYTEKGAASAKPTAVGMAPRKF